MQKQVNHIAECCYRLGITKAVLCPGSRNAPLLLAFSRHPGIQCYSIPDERSAAFIAVGMAGMSREAVALICTSGTAALNFYPAIAEAYYREIPLLVLTADRPPELIDQWDGQAIHQEDIFDKHIRGSFQAPDDLSEESSGEYLSELTIHAIQLAKGQIPGPVHINLPFREPLYPRPDEEFVYPKIELPGEQSKDIKTDLPSELIRQIESSEKIMLLAGSELPDPGRSAFLKELHASGKLVVLADIASGSYQSGIPKWDLLIGSLSPEKADSLAPELLISIGTSTVSKKLKEMLRRNKPAAHWHISASGTAADPFNSFPRIHQSSQKHFLMRLLAATAPKSKSAYFEQWNVLHTQLEKKIQVKMDRFSELLAAKTVLESLPAGSVLHLANSMPVRYASMLGVPENIEVHCNRGTSGIDGCSSTAVGSSLLSGQQNYLLTGDIAFFYDVNAFWHPYIPGNLRIILLNNKGGGIFRLIDGPASQPELAERFETRHNRTAEHVCRDFGIRYFSASDEQSLISSLKDFHASTGCTLLEIHSEPEQNSTAYHSFRKSMMLTAPGDR